MTRAPATPGGLRDRRPLHAGSRTGRTRGALAVGASAEDLGLDPGEDLLSPWITDSGRGVDRVRHRCTLRMDPAPGPFGGLQLDPKSGVDRVRSDGSVRRTACVRGATGTPAVGVSPHRGGTSSGLSKEYTP